MYFYSHRIVKGAAAGTLNGLKCKLKQKTVDKFEI